MTLSSHQIIHHASYSPIATPTSSQLTTPPTILPHSHGVDVGRQTGKTDVEMVVHLKNLLKVGGHSLTLDPQPLVCCYGNAFLTHHGHNGRSVVIHDRLETKRVGRDTTVIFTYRT